MFYGSGLLSFLSSAGSEYIARSEKDISPRFNMPHFSRVSLHLCTLSDYNPSVHSYDSLLCFKRNMPQEEWKLSRRYKVPLRSLCLAHGEKQKTKNRAPPFLQMACVSLKMKLSIIVQRTELVWYPGYFYRNFPKEKKSLSFKKINK